ncbi:MAG TPA: PEP-CTERM sorting domain-containing protein [Acidimicrobiales bacterium]|nr:PEP-CTERM sorting domain-containing protein [Acidimicrobiales bacterium]
MPEPDSARRSRWLPRILVGTLIALAVTDRIGAALTAYLATHHPLALVGLDPTDKSLLLAIHVSVVPFVLLAVSRRLAGQILYFLIGRHLGAQARALLERHGAGRIVARVEGLFRRASLPVILVAPRDVVCILAGDTGIAFPVFLALVLVRDVAMVAAVRAVSGALSGTINHVLTTLNHWVIPATIIGFALAAGSLYLRRRRTAGIRRAATAAYGGEGTPEPAFEVVPVEPAGADPA